MKPTLAGLEARALAEIEAKRGRWSHDSEFGAAMPYALETRRFITRDVIRAVAIARAAEEKVEGAIAGREGRGACRLSRCAHWSAEAKHGWARALVELLRWAAR